MTISTELPKNQTEWLESDGRGGFASGTVCGIRTRRYHAILLTATTPPSGRMVLVNGFDADFENEAGVVPLSTQRFQPGVDSPAGSTHLESFKTEPWPQWTWALPQGGKIQLELFVPHGQPAVVLRWRCFDVKSHDQKLHVRPFFSGRDFHSLHHENPAFDFTPQQIADGLQRWNFYPGVPAVFARSNGLYQHEPCWYRDFLYDEERLRGLDYLEDLAAPGRYTFDLQPNPAILVFSTTHDESFETAGQLVEKWSQAELARRGDFATPQLRAADSYLVQRGEGKTIIAGYPWFGDWGRDTFISMRGLCLATERLQEAHAILVAWAATVSEGMLPNRFADTGDTPEFNSVDASLWYVIVVHEFLEAVQDDEALLREKDELLAAVDSILTGYSQGTRYQIHADADGLLACGQPGVQLTWMDAKVDDWVVTPRIGKPVEVQALWLNALGLAARYDSKWSAPYKKGLSAFEQRFWNAKRNCLYDVIDVDHQPGTVDESLRPNQLFAIGGLPLQLLSGERASHVVQTVQDHLWTPMGPRSLGPDEKDYAPFYQGDRWARDGSYHQGTVWPWLTGPFLEAWVRVHGDTNEARAEGLKLLEASHLLQPDLQGLNHIPEIADAQAPHLARGCPFQAWSMGEILRLKFKILQPKQVTTRLNENEPGLPLPK